MVRVLHVLPRFRFGGIPVMVMNLYRAIDRNKVQFDFVIFTKEHGVFNDEIESMGGRIFYIPKFNGKNFLAVRKAWDDFFTAHPEYKILHSHVRSTAFLYLSIAKKHGVITIEHSHSTSNGSGIGSIVKYVFQLPLKYQADYLFACSDIAGQWLYGKNVLSKNNYKMVPNGIRLDDFRYSYDTRDELRKALGVKDELVIGHSGRFHEAKNHKFLLEIFKKVKNKNDDVKLLLVGDGDLRKTIEEEIDRLHIRDSVIITGMIRDVAPYYSAMDIFVFPSIWEGLPVSVVEAQAAGLPCLISDTITRQVGFSELVKTIPINKGSDIWAEAILNSDYERRDVSSSIRNAGFDIQCTALDLMDFYCSIIAESTIN